MGCLRSSIVVNFKCLWCTHLNIITIFAQKLSYMKKKILEILKTRFSGVKEAILDKVAATYAKKVSDESEIDNVLDGVTLDSLYETYADIRATESATSSVANYERKYGIVKGKKVKASDQTEDDDDIAESEEGAQKKSDSNNVTAQLLAELKSLRTEVNTLKSGKITDTRRAKLNDILKDLTPIQRKGYDRMAIDNISDEEFDAMLGEVKDEVAEIARDNKSKGGIFGAPLTGGDKVTGKEASEAEISAVVDLL